MYFLYSEVFHFLNLFNLPRFFIMFCVYLAIGIALRCAVKKKKEFYTVSLVAFIIWLLCEITYSIIGAKDLLGAVGIGTLGFSISWILFCVLLGAWAAHLGCFLFRKKKLE